MKRIIFILAILFGFNTYTAQMSQQEKQEHLSSQQQNELEQIVITNKQQVIYLLDNLLEIVKRLKVEQAPEAKIKKIRFVQKLQEILNLVHEHQFNDAYKLLNDIQSLQHNQYVNDQISLILKYLELISNLLSKYIKMLPKDLAKIVIDYLPPFSWQLDKNFDLISPIDQVKFSPDGSKLAAINRFGLIIWDSNTGDEILKVLNKVSYFISWSPDGKKLISISKDGDKTIWDVDNNVQLKEFKDMKPSKYVKWSPDGSKIASDSKTDFATVTIWDTLTNQILKTFKSRQVNAINMIWSPDSKKILIPDFDKYAETISIIYDVLTGNELLRITDFGILFSSISWSPNGKYIAFTHYQELPDTSPAYSINIINSETGNIVKELKRDKYQIDSIAWSPDSKKIVSGSNDGTIRIWDVDTQKQTHLLKGHTANILSVDWSSDGSKIASGSVNGKVKIWTKN